MSAKFTRPLNNTREQSTEDELAKAVAQFGGRLVTKIRVADVFDVDAMGLTGNIKSYALKAHLDFVIYDDRGLKPLFAVEYDGPQHASDAAAKKDRDKNQICQFGDLPLLRVDRDYLENYGTFSLVRWLAEVFFLKQQFDAAQSSGGIGQLETFHPMFFEDVTNPYVPSHYPFFEVHQELSNADDVRAFAYGMRVTETEDGRLFATAIAEMADGAVIFSGASLRAFQFPAFDPKELVAELAVCDLADRVRRYRSTGQGAPTTEARETLFSKFELWPRALVGGSSGKEPIPDSIERFMAMKEASNVPPNIKTELNAWLKELRGDVPPARPEQS